MADVYVVSPSVPVVWIMSQMSSLMLTLNCRIAVLQRVGMCPRRWYLLFPGMCLQMWKRMRTLMILTTVQVGVSRWCYSSQQDLVPASLPPPPLRLHQVSQIGHLPHSITASSGDGHYTHLPAIVHARETLISGDDRGESGPR